MVEVLRKGTKLIFYYYSGSLLLLAGLGGVHIRWIKCASRICIKSLLLS